MSDANGQRVTVHDSPWKDVLESHFAEFLALLFADIHHHIDWSKGYSFLDKKSYNRLPLTPILADVTPIN